MRRIIGDCEEIKWEKEENQMVAWESKGSVRKIKGENEENQMRGMKKIKGEYEKNQRVCEKQREVRCKPKGNIKNQRGYEENHRGTEELWGM